MEKSGKDAKGMYGDELPPPYTEYPGGHQQQPPPPPPTYHPPQQEKQPFFANHFGAHYGEPSLLDLANNVTASANRLAAAASATAFHASMNMTTGMPNMAMPPGGLTTNTTKVIQLISPVTGRALRVLPDGTIDAMAKPNEPAAQFIQLQQGNDVVILRNAAKQEYHLEIVKDQLIGNGSGSDFNAQFRIHIGKGGLVCFESMSSPGQNISVNSDGTVKLTQSTSGNESYFNVRVLASSSVQTSHPATTFVTQEYRVK